MEKVQPFLKIGKGMNFFSFLGGRKPLCKAGRKISLVFLGAPWLGTQFCDEQYHLLPNK